MKRKFKAIGVLNGFEGVNIESKIAIKLSSRFPVPYT